MRFATSTHFMKVHFWGIVPMLYFNYIIAAMKCVYHIWEITLYILISKNPRASEMDPTWVAHRLLPDLGLGQYTEVFEEQLCDGCILDTLTRRDLEKHFNVHRKFHQTSILHAIELLRRIEFNKDVRVTLYLYQDNVHV